MEKLGRMVEYVLLIEGRGGLWSWVVDATDGRGIERGLASTRELVWELVRLALSHRMQRNEVSAG
jgi:hypothetical protein